MPFKCGIFLVMLVGGIGYCAGVCYDQHIDCAEWAHRGDCQSNPGYLLIHCPISCRVDCVPCRDSDSQCAADAKKGWCHNSYAYSTVHHCPKSCGACF